MSLAIIETLDRIEDAANLRVLANRTARRSLECERAGDWESALACEELLVHIHHLLALIEENDQ